LISVEFTEYFNEDGSFEGIHEFLEMDFSIHVEVLNEKINDSFFKLAFILLARDDEVQIAFVIDIEYFLGDEFRQLTGLGFKKLMPTLGHHPF
jgi:hypothetical protein